MRQSMLKQWLWALGCCAGLAVAGWGSALFGPSSGGPAAKAAPAGAAGTAREVATLAVSGGNPWIEVGPWTHVGPRNLAGPAQDIVVDAASGHLYALTPEGWVFRSTDGAGTWSPVVRFRTDMPMHRLAIQRSAAGVTAFLGIGQAPMEPPGHLLRMTPDGTTEEMLVADVRDVRTSGNRIYAVTDSGIWTTDDDGAYWTHALAGATWSETVGCKDLEVAGNDVFALCSAYDSSASTITRNVYRSTGGGAFAKIWSAPEEVWITGKSHMAVSPSDPRTVYVAFEHLPGSSYKKGAHVFRSTDGGASWTRRFDPAGPNEFHADLLGDFEKGCVEDFGEQTSDFVLEVDPVDPQRVWIGSVELYRSDDGGQTFGRASLESGKAPGAAYALPSGLRAVRFASTYNGTTIRNMYVATADGVHATADARASVQQWPQTSCTTAGTPPASSWQLRINGYATANVQQVDVHASGQALATLALGKPGLFYGDLADPDSWYRMSDDAPGTIRIDPERGLDRFFTSRCAGGDFCRWDWNPGTGAWDTFATVVREYDTNPRDRLFVPDPSDPSRFWGDFDGVAGLSTDAMSSWEIAGYLVRPDYLGAGAVSPFDPNLVLLSGVGTINRREDALTAAANTDWPSTSLHTFMWSITDVVFDPSDRNRIALTASHTPSLMISRDAGRTWLDAHGALPDVFATSAAFEPDNTNVFYLGTRTGLYLHVPPIETDGVSWYRLDAPFGDTPINMVQLRKDDAGNGRLFVFTEGRGIWSATVRVRRFVDVPFDHWAHSAIERLFRAGVTGGCATAPPGYCPGDPVRRDQMALFLLRAKHGLGYQPPAAKGLFADVPASHWAAAWIERLRAEGITGGCGSDPLRYCPTVEVSRAEMAVFLLRARHGAGYQPPAATGLFADVPTTFWAAAWIEQLARDGIAGGCSATTPRFCPATTVTRDQMAVFLTRAFDL